MERLTTHTGRVAPLLRDNIDTDLLIPSREMTTPSREGMGEKLLANWRYLPSEDGQRIENPDFVLNQPAFRQASILVAGRNFGSGSSREAAAWAVRQFGFRCVVAPSFGAIFQNNCYRNGIAPVVLPEEQVQRLADSAAGGTLELTVDVGARLLRLPDGSTLPFPMAQAEHAMLHEGLDAIGLTWKLRTQIEAFQARDRAQRPWIWETGAPAA